MRNKKATTNTPTMLPQVRIIGGQWRSRKLDFPQVEGLRPTPDRVRETLFNWLHTAIPGAHCLDLFSGSGALGLEALSRGASDCTFIDIAHPSCNTLRQNITKLGCDNATVVQADTISWLGQQQSIAPNADRSITPQTTASKFDVVFLDPPFHKDFCQKACDVLIEKQLLNENAFVYIETERRVDIKVDWTLHREKTAGQVHYRLYKV